MDVVTSRDLLRFPSKYIVPDTEFVVTKRGIKVYVVTTKPYKEPEVLEPYEPTCKIEGCIRPAFPGHKDYCIKHWREKGFNLVSQAPSDSRSKREVSQQRSTL